MVKIKLNIPEFSQYRILKVGEKYVAQRRILLFWWDTINTFSNRTMPWNYYFDECRFKTLEQAELRILEYKRDKLQHKIDNRKQIIKGIK